MKVFYRGESMAPGPPPRTVRPRDWPLSPSPTKRCWRHAGGDICPMPPKTGFTPQRQPGFDEHHYKERNTVERAFNRLKQSRAVATRYNKRGYVFLGTATVAALTIRCPTGSPARLSPARRSATPTRGCWTSSRSSTPLTPTRPRPSRTPRRPRSLPRPPRRKRGLGPQGRRPRLPGTPRPPLMLPSLPLRRPRRGRRAPPGRRHQRRTSRARGSGREQLPILDQPAGRHRRQNGQQADRAFTVAVL
jgi:transposase